MTITLNKPDPAAKQSYSWLEITLIVACTLLIVAKFWLIPRININWDEFYFLAHVHALPHGRLTLGLQTAYTHLFTWLVALPGDEVSQINAARLVMVGLLAVSAWLVYRLASRWHPTSDALIAALAFIALLPTMRHGASFRADSLLLPLQMGALVALTNPRINSRTKALVCGSLLGCAAAISVKAILLAPVVAMLSFPSQNKSTGQVLRRWMIQMGYIAVSAAVCFVILIAAHLGSLDSNATITAQQQFGSAWYRNIAEIEFLPQLNALKAVIHADTLILTIALVGLATAASIKQWRVVACGLALLPVFFYRNSFQYYFVVMYAPATVLIASAVKQIRDVTSRLGSKNTGLLTSWAMTAIIGFVGLDHLRALSTPRQAQERAVVAATHQIFPHSVPYIDHSGMIASFPKANFFMSRWGMDQYAESGRAFMPDLLKKQRPPLLIVNRSPLQEGTQQYWRLFKEDRDALERFYISYWGPIRVAGAKVVITNGERQTMQLPFAGSYRLESPNSMTVNGVTFQPGDIVKISDVSEVLIQAVQEIQEPLLVRLIWAAAQTPPTVSMPFGQIYDPL